MFPLQWMGAVRTRVQTADKNITMIHKQSIFGHKRWLKVITPWWICFFTNSFSFHKMLIDELKLCGSSNVFISCLNSSDGTHSLQRIHWWKTDVNFFKYVLIKKQTYLHLRWPYLQQIFVCWWTISLIKWV